MPIPDTLARKITDDFGAEKKYGGRKNVCDALPIKSFYFKRRVKLPDFILTDAGAVFRNDGVSIEVVEAAFTVKSRRVVSASHTLTWKHKQRCCHLLTHWALGNLNEILDM